MTTLRGKQTVVMSLIWTIAMLTPASAVIAVGASTSTIIISRRTFQWSMSSTQEGIGMIGSILQFGSNMTEHSGK